MVLPHISTHVGSPATWLPGNPVALFHESVRRLADLPPDMLVLPSHGDPFVGLRERVAELELHHEARCRTIAGALGEPRSAYDLLQVVFQRELDPLQLMLAMNEAIAHLEYMTDRGELIRLAGDDGITRYVRGDA
jgi:glyoxylase-like metal-dependent hydrolase (beta-lactamase superfamily II)